MSKFFDELYDKPDVFKGELPPSGPESGPEEENVHIELGIPDGYSPTRLPGIIMPTEIWEAIEAKREVPHG